ncbi:DUF6318 family protein [Actinotalea sp. C106]|uniref:DUF6318 family protein n=1 Tax=Actinotalea sp. C106 TaxID=2908644 RepID=UPI002027A0AC|nr:DUF6318 family protein [Actinotalea sp. C106]
MEQGEVWGVLSSSGARRPVRGGRRVAAWVAGVAVLGAVLTGCTDPEPAPSPPPAAATPTPTPTPSETVEEIAAPERPAEMERTDEVGAIAAAEYFMQLFAYVMATGDLEEWDRVSAQDCGFCSGLRSDVEGVYGAGGKYQGGGVALEGTEVLGFEEVIGAYTVATSYSIQPLEQLDASGEVVEVIDAETGDAGLDVIYSARGWTLLGASTLEKSP